MSFMVNPFILFPPSAAGTPFDAVESFSLDGSLYVSTARLGFIFTPSIDLTCNTLKSNVNASTSNELIIVHRVSDGVQMASASATVISDSFVEVSVAEFVLLSGVSYVCSGRRDGITGASRTTRRNNTIAFNSDITVSGYRFSEDDNLPTGVTGNTYAHTSFGYA